MPGILEMSLAGDDVVFIIALGMILQVTLFVNSKGTDIVDKT